MKTGIELIAAERQEQIEKHGFNKDHDEEMSAGELKDAATYLLTGELNYFPKGWDEKYHLKFRSKFSNEIETLKVAGALIAAEIDRIQSTEKSVIEQSEQKATPEAEVRDELIKFLEWMSWTGEYTFLVDHYFKCKENK